MGKTTRRREQLICGLEDKVKSPNQRARQRVAVWRDGIGQSLDKEMFGVFGIQEHRGHWGACVTGLKGRECPHAKKVP